MKVMKEKLTLILILHNRHTNLDRLLEFYNNFESAIYIADSSFEEHVFLKELKGNVRYEYTPGVSYTQKVELALANIFTPYVAMCADDDFIIPSGLYQCAEFLENNIGYVSAQGMILRYYKNTIQSKLRFDMLYEGDHSMVADTPEERINNLFMPYKALLYAVHRTSVLKMAFENAGVAFKNLYLNEYLTSIFPLIKGKSKDLPLLYQVREYDKASDDKTTENIDTIITEKKYNVEYESFLNHIVSKSVTKDGVNLHWLKNIIETALKNYAVRVKGFKQTKMPVNKKIGQVIRLVPVIGERLVQTRRLKLSMKRVQKYLTEQDWQQLHEIERILKRYSKT